MEIKDKNEISEDANSKVYELGYLLVPTLAQEDVPQIYGDLKELIAATFHGEIIADEMPKMINLAYPMQKVISNARSKFSTAYFGWIKFTMDAKQVLELKRQLDLDPKIIRFLILKTVKENTIATKRFIHRETKRPFVVKKTEGDKILTSVEKEKIDKEIDALIAN